MLSLQERVMWGGSQELLRRAMDDGFLLDVYERVTYTSRAWYAYKWQYRPLAQAFVEERGGRQSQVETVLKGLWHGASEVMREECLARRFVCGAFDMQERGRRPELITDYLLQVSKLSGMLASAGISLYPISRW
jgi:hypothetical protein